MTREGAAKWPGVVEAGGPHKGLNSPKRFTNLLSGLNGFNASIWISWSPSDPQSYDSLVEVFKFIRHVLHFCAYSTIRFTLRFVNLFIEVSRVCVSVCNLKVEESLTVASSFEWRPSHEGNLYCMTGNNFDITLMIFKFSGKTQSRILGWGWYWIPKLLKTSQPYQ